MPNFRERLRTLKTGLWLQLIPRTCFIRCAFTCMVASVFCTACCSRTRSWFSQNRLAPDSLVQPVPTTLPVWFFRVHGSSVKMSRITVRSREVLNRLFFSFAVTTPLHRCFAAYLAWERFVYAGLMLTILGVWLAAQTALTFILHVSLQVYRKLVSMFTTDHLPTEVPMFSVMKFPRPTRIAVERANGYHAFVQSRGRSLRAVALAGGRWSSSMVTSLSWRSATVVLSILDASFKFVRASFLVSGVCAGRMSASVRMRQKQGSRSRFLKDAVSLLRRWGVSRSGQGSRAVPGPSVPGHVRASLHRARCS